MNDKNDISKSLDKISDNLAAINETIRETKKKKEDKQPKSKQIDTFRLIRIVDKKESTLFKGLDVFRGALGIIFGSLLIIAIVVFLFMIVDGLFLHTLGTGGDVALGLSCIAVIFAFYSLVAEIGEENMFSVRAGRILKLSDLTEDKKPLNEDEIIILKAAIKIKSKHSKIPLKQIYNLHPAMFIKEKLLEKLYE